MFIYSSTKVAHTGFYQKVCIINNKLKQGLWKILELVLLAHPMNTGGKHSQCQVHMHREGITYKANSEMPR